MCAPAQVGTWQLIHFACTFSPDTVFFFCRSSEQAQGSPLELVEVTSSPPHSHLPAMIDWRRNVWVTLQASPVHCSLGACPLNMFVQRVLVWRQVSLRISARLEQCSPGLIHFLRGQSIEVIGQCILFLNLVFCML